MKHMIAISVLLVICTGLQAQTFTFYRTSPEIIYTNDTFGVTSHAKIFSMPSGTNRIRLIRTVVNMPPGWESCICDIVQCHPTGMDTAIADYPQGNSNIDVMLYSHSIPGTGFVTIRAEKFTNTNENYSVTFGGAFNPIGIQQISGIVKDFTLGQNYPNPFNPSTKIYFAIPKSDFVSLKVYDMLGREVIALVNSNLSAGEYEVDFDAGRLSSGMYYYRIQSGDYISVKKMVLVK
jgi:hypothetical protein